jgi:pimeloyl-[acyl-carrier protein] methyl ester esterase
MNKQWIKHKNNSKVIIFFNGWGMDNKAINHLDTTGYELCVLNDYSRLNLIEETFSGYQEIYVIAWSLGIWAASCTLSKNTVPIKKAIAINGTVTPVDAAKGIPPDIFKGTLEGWNEKTRESFQMRMTGGKKKYLPNRSKFGNRTIEDQKTELEAIYRQLPNKGTSDFAFDLAIIGSGDAIFTPKNQLNYWRGKTHCMPVDMPHYPFLHFTTWNEIINQYPNNDN